MRKYPKALWAVLLSVAVVVVLDAASPWWTLKNMRDAAVARDSERLATYIDFPRVRSNLREQLVSLADAKGPSPAYEAVLRRVGVRSIIDPIIDVIVSPEAMRVALMVAPSRSSETRADGATESCGVKRDGVRQFRLRCARLPNGNADLVFERRGFGWVLVGIDLPADYGALVP